MTTTMCVFAKLPVAGQVKTRLAADVGTAMATRLAWAFLQDTLVLAQRLPNTQVVLALSGDASALPPMKNTQVWPQGEGDLGARLERTLAMALTRTKHAIAIGTDSPGLPLPLLEQAVSHLQTRNAAIGPAQDGGFYLLGLDACEPGLLQGLPWSSPHTLAATSARLQQTQRTIANLPVWFDVDTAQDLERLRELLRKGHVWAPATAAALEDTTDDARALA